MTKKKNHDLNRKETAAERTMNFTEIRTLTIHDLSDLCVDQGWFGDYTEDSDWFGLFSNLFDDEGNSVIMTAERLLKIAEYISDYTVSSGYWSDGPTLTEIIEKLLYICDVSFCIEITE